MAYDLDSPDRLVGQVAEPVEIKERLIEDAVKDIGVLQFGWRQLVPQFQRPLEASLFSVFLVEGRTFKYFYHRLKDMRNVRASYLHKLELDLDDVQLQWQILRGFRYPFVST